MSGYAATDYVDVAHRLVEFRDKHPEGSLQPADLGKPYTIEDISGQTFIIVVAAAYRTPDDTRPGIGMAYEIFPGKTNFTRGSELQNAETSAWGRAIVASLAADAKLGIASAEEMRNRAAEQVAKSRKPAEPSGPPVKVARQQPVPREPDPTPTAAGPRPITPEQITLFHTLFGKLGYGKDDRAGKLEFVGEVLGFNVASSKDLTMDQARVVLDSLTSRVEAINA